MTTATRLPSGSRESRMGFGFGDFVTQDAERYFFHATMRDRSPERHARHLLKETLFFRWK